MLLIVSTRLLSSGIIRVGIRKFSVGKAGKTYKINNKLIVSEGSDEEDDGEEVISYIGSNSISLTDKSAARLYLTSSLADLPDKLNLFKPKFYASTDSIGK